MLLGWTNVVTSSCFSVLNGTEANVPRAFLANRDAETHFIHIPTYPLSFVLLSVCCKVRVSTRSCSSFDCSVHSQTMIQTPGFSWFWTPVKSRVQNRIESCNWIQMHNVKIVLNEVWRMQGQSTNMFELTSLWKALSIWSWCRPHNAWIGHSWGAPPFAWTWLCQKRIHSLFLRWCDAKTCKSEKCKNALRACYTSKISANYIYNYILNIYHCLTIVWL